MELHHLSSTQMTRLFLYGSYRKKHHAHAGSSSGSYSRNSVNCGVRTASLDSDVRVGRSGAGSITPNDVPSAIMLFRPVTPGSVMLTCRASSGLIANRTPPSIARYQAAAGGWMASHFPDAATWPSRTAFSRMRASLLSETCLGTFSVVA